MENQRDFCNECGGERGIPGLMDYNIKEITSSIVASEREMG